MTLLTALIAALVCSVLWYVSERSRRLKVGTLALFYWGAALMWLVDACVEYAQAGEGFFRPSAGDMLNDAFLGLCAVTLGALIWFVYVLVTDPDHTVRDVLKGRKA
ncbi:MAG: hypothetical protein IJ806_11515 [Ruminococcus sp.]|nr:hypothetical protein [Ruminococcus sp.]MBR1864702.1 hypothetical protein [Ruminococcus sp.]